jgi:hypothetical protein
LLPIQFILFFLFPGVGCPPGWSFRPPGKCFELYTDAVNFGDAKDACVALGGNLAVANSSEDLDFLVDLGGWV